jgi:hypothetical protein
VHHGGAILVLRRAREVDGVDNAWFLREDACRHATSHGSGKQAAGAMSEATTQALPAGWQGLHPARAEGLEIEAAADGFIVYHGDRDRIHYLNHTAPLLLELCDGRRAAAGLAAVLAQLYSLAAPPRADVEQALAQLHDEGLIEWLREPAEPPAGGSRAGG